MTDKIDLITEHFIPSENICIRRFIKRVDSSWTINDVKKYLEESIKSELNLNKMMRPVIEIEKKNNDEKLSFYNFDDQYIQDYNPFGNKINVSLRITWSMCSQGINNPVITQYDIPTGSSEQTVTTESDSNSKTATMNTVEHKSSSSATPKVLPSLSKNLKRKQTDSIKHKSKQTMTNPKKKKYLSPNNIVSLEVRSDGTNLIIDSSLTDYDSANIPLITNFNSNNALKFRHDINKHQRVEYMSNIRPIQQQTNSSNAIKATKKFRNLVPIQREKTDKIDKFQQALPILEIPDRCIPKSVEELAILCVVIVREYEINNEEIGYNVVGNRRLSINPNPDKKDLDEYFLETLTKDNVNGNLHELLLYMMQLPGEIDKKIGPALFKIARQSGETVDIGYKIGEKIGSYRLAIFGLQINDNNLLKPNFENLCLSNYFHQN